MKSLKIKSLTKSTTLTFDGVQCLSYGLGFSVGSY